MRRLTLLLALLLVSLLLPGVAHADGIIIDPPPPCPLGESCPPPPCNIWPCPRPLFPLAIENHHVTVTIEDQVAVTRVDQSFRNDNDFTVEGIYLFPLPLDAAVNAFALWVDGRKVDGQLLTAEEARRVYDDIVRQTRDPALLEYIGRGAFQASVFPIAPGESRRVELEYTQVLPADSGLVHYRYPLNTEKFSALPLEQVSIAVKVVSPDPIKAVYSPSHPVAISRSGDYRFSAGYEASDVIPDTDFDLYYSVSPDDIGLNLLTFRDPSEEEGFFLLLAAPRVEVGTDQVVAKDVIVVLDQSGSMDGVKFHQAQEALKYVLAHLNREDRFNIIAFSTGTRQYARDLRPASQADEAAGWVDALTAEGGTNINLALLEALSLVAERPAILIFLTDGLATEGVTVTEDILASVSQAAPDNVRLFAFGVGDDVDTVLLDTLVEQNRGLSAYVRPGQRIDETVSGFYARVSTPVLSDIKLDFGGIQVEDLYPQPLPDLFAGSQLVLAGRYRDSGAAEITLRGVVNGQLQTFRYPDQFFLSRGGNEFIPRLWATRKIGYLLNQIRLHGEDPELVEAIVKLSVRYGIITPYTSYLVTEGDEVLSEEGRSRVAADAFAEMLAAPPAEVSGAEAVDKAVAQSDLAEAQAAAAPAGEAAAVVRLAGSRTFLYSNGVWIDTGFDVQAMRAAQVQFASQDYFDLLSARPELAAAFALGPRVIALDASGTAYEVVDDGAPPLNLPATYTPAPAETPAPGQTPAPLNTLHPTATPFAVAGGPTPAGQASTPVPTPLPAPRSGGLCAAALLPLGLVFAAGALALRRRRRA